MRKQLIKLRRASKYLLPAIFVLGLLVPFPFTYSYQLYSLHTEGVPDPFSDREDQLKGREVHELDTLLKVGATVALPMFREDCGALGFHTIVVEQTLGGTILSAITFGRYRRVKIKYVCVKP